MDPLDYDAIKSLMMGPFAEFNRFLDPSSLDYDSEIERLVMETRPDERCGENLLGILAYAFQRHQERRER